MRLWHYKIVEYLPKGQLIAQWRELNSIFKKQDSHILINYAYEYSPECLMFYTAYVISEMKKRRYKIKSFDNYTNFFRDKGCDDECIKDCMSGYKPKTNPFPNHHTTRYLRQCYYNLQEKYDRCQKDFSKEEYLRLTTFFLEFEKRLFVI